MPTTRNFHESLDSLPQDRRERVEAGVHQLELRTLIAILSQYTGQTPTDVATILGLRDVGLDGLELHDELPASVLADLIRRLGGEMEVIVRFPQGLMSISEFQVPSEADFEAESIDRRQD